MEEKIRFIGPFWPAEENTSGSTQSSSTTQSTTNASQTATTQSTDQTATTQAESWQSLGSKTYNVTVEVPTCGISVTNVGFTLLKNGSPTTDTTFLTTDDIGARMTFTVAPAGTNCAGQGAVKLSVTVDKGNPLENSKSYSKLTESKSDSIDVDIGKLSAGSHTIVLEGYYMNSNSV